MITAKMTPFEQAASYLGELKPLFAGLSGSVSAAVREIRLRAGRAVALELPDRRLKLGTVVTAEQIAACMREFCGYSVHSCEKQFREGWLTLAGGHRAGFTGTAVLKDGKVENVREVSSVNLRIAREFPGCGEDLFSRISRENVGGLLIAGPPMSAKTTVLRDLCRLISAKSKVALIDERAEIAAVHAGVPSLDVGENTDVLNSFPKAQGIMTALRSLSPEYVVCDEIGWESAEVAECANSGVKMIAAVHAGSVDEVYSSPRTARLLATGGFTHVVLLGTGADIGKTLFFSGLRSGTESPNPARGLCPRTPA